MSRFNNSGHTFFKPSLLKINNWVSIKASRFIALLTQWHSVQIWIINQISRSVLKNLTLLDLPLSPASPSLPASYPLSLSLAFPEELRWGPSDLAAAVDDFVWSGVFLSGALPDPLLGLHSELSYPVDPPLLDFALLVLVVARLSPLEFPEPAKINHPTLVSRTILQAVLTSGLRVWRLCTR